MNRRTLKSLFPLAVAFGALLFAAAGSAADSDEKLAKVRAKVAGMFEQIEPQHVQYSPLDGWFTVQKGSVIAYISDDGRYLMQGDLIDLDNNVNLTNASRDSARRDLVAALDEKDVIAFTPDEVKSSVIVFTDIDCTYCRRLHNEIDKYMALGIEVRYLLYPRNGPASKSWGTAEQVWCSSDRNKALTAAKSDRAFQSSPCDASIVQDHYVLGHDAGLSGTPAIILEDGTLIGGYMPPDALAQRISLMAATE
jgi:thiol:disulfide interchange protein DsbC